ncbi:MAG: hypothetical protein ABSG63_02655 [Spirochaetia bacterium]|jgi:hypothetical protein
MGRMLIISCLLTICASAFALDIEPETVILPKSDGETIIKALKEWEQDSKNEKLNVTSSYRTEQKQAELMAGLDATTLRNWYFARDEKGSKITPKYISDMIKAQSEQLKQDDLVKRFANYIHRTIAKKEGFVSHHLTGDAVDIRPPKPKRARAALREFLHSKGITVKDETVDNNNCWHLQLAITKPVKSPLPPVFLSEPEKIASSPIATNRESGVSMSMKVQAGSFGQSEADSATKLRGMVVGERPDSDELSWPIEEGGDDSE